MRASTASLLVLLAALPAAAQDPAAGQDPAPAASGEASLTVPTGTAPVVDGTIGESEWAAAAPFVVGRGVDVYGNGWVLRSGRQLYLGFDSKVTPWGIGLRVTVTDPVSRRETMLLVTPINPPRPPLAAFRTLVDRPPERLPVVTCDIRFSMAGRQGFGFEARVPLDLLEIGSTEKEYRFALEVWALGDERVIAAYPQDARTAVAQASPAVLKSVGAWGAGEDPRASPPPNEALALLQEIESEPEEQDAPFFPRDAGWLEGRRRDAPLADLEARAARIAAACPDLIPVRTFLVQVRIARNDPAAALATLEELGAYLPQLATTPRHLLIRSQLLRDLGRYDDSRALLTEHAEELKDDPIAGRELSDVLGWREAWRVEQLIRKAEAERDDLPRVRLTTTKGDIDIELFEDDAPNGVANFISLVESGFYAGTRFHWASGGDHVVGGDPNSKDDDPHNDGYGDPGYLIESEPGRRLTFPMSVAFADKRRERRTEGSAFSIFLAPFPPGDGVNTVLGRVLAGEDVVRRLEYYDKIEKAAVLRKRAHPYTPVKR
ncbi:MAG TPA: peptidylprolyl isomerase [Planctomycetota bacterium]|nr:peptidylprolyl isomerase [Planctomycetota bacterium]